MTEYNVFQLLHSIITFVLITYFTAIVFWLQMVCQDLEEGECDVVRSDRSAEG